MLARFWRSILTLSLLAAVAWFAFWSSRGADAVAWVGALVLGLSHVPIMAIEFFILLPLVNRDDPAPPSTWLQRARAWAHECVTAVRVFAWQQAFREHAVPDHLGDPARPGALKGKRPLVLVHGFVCNRGLWNRWMRRLRADDVPFIAVSLEPVFGSITGYAATVDDAVRRATDATGVAPIIVAHSMGGLAARAWLHAHEDGDARIAGVVTIGTPHHGTSLARSGISANVRDMQRSGRWLKELGAHEPATRWTAFTCFWSHCDNIVMPSSTATLEGARNLHIEASGHVALIDRPEVFDAVMELQRQALQRTPPVGTSHQALREANGAVTA